MKKSAQHVNDNRWKYNGLQQEVKVTLNKSKALKDLEK